MRKNFKDENIAKMYHTLQLIMIQKAVKEVLREHELRDRKIRKRYLNPVTPVI